MDFIRKATHACALPPLSLPCAADQERQRATDEELLRKQAQKQSIEIGKQRAQAEERARDADAARVAAVALRTETVRQLARLYVGQGTALMDSGDLTGALVPFVRALSSAHAEKLPEDAHRLRIAALLSRRLTRP